MRRVKDVVILTSEEYEALKKSPKKKKAKRRTLKSITASLFVTTQVAAIFWVSASYIIAFYSTLKLGQPFPVEELSRQAIISLLGVSFLKVLENVFEHNDGVIWGTSKNRIDSEKNENSNEAEG